MSCNICLQSDNLINSCPCQSYEKCIESGYYDIYYGKVVTKSDLSCPKYKAIIMQLSGNDEEGVSMFEIIEKDSESRHILCPSCRHLKKYACNSCLTYKLICDDCVPKTRKECPGCGILIEKVEGYLCTTCICGTKFCWLCLEIYDEDGIYNHNYKKHGDTLDEKLKYEYYLHAVRWNNLKLSDVSEKYWTRELILSALEGSYTNLKFIESRELCLETVKENGWALDYVKNQDRELCLEAVKQNGNALKCVKNQDREICLEAIKQKGHALRYVKNQDREMCLIAVNQNGHALKYVENPDREIYLIAIKENSHALQYVKNKDFEICLEAIKNDGNTLQYVNGLCFSTEEYTTLCLNAVKNNGFALQYVRIDLAVHNEILLEAVKQNGMVLQFVKKYNLTREDYREVCLEAVKQNGLALQFIENPVKYIYSGIINKRNLTIEDYQQICSEAIKENNLALEYAENQTKELCLEAVGQHACMLKYVNWYKFNSFDYYQICLSSVKKGGFSLKYVKKHKLTHVNYEEICLIAKNNTSECTNIQCQVGKN